MTLTHTDDTDDIFIACLCSHTCSLTCDPLLRGDLCLPATPAPLVTVERAAVGPSHHQRMQMSSWMTFKLPSGGFLSKHLRNSSQLSPARHSKRQKTDLYWKLTLAKLHIAVINQPRRTCPAWIISRLSLQRLPQPLFSLLRLFGRPPTKAQAAFLAAPSSLFTRSDQLCASLLSLEHARGQSVVTQIIQKERQGERRRSEKCLLCELFSFAYLFIFFPFLSRPSGRTRQNAFHLPNKAVKLRRWLHQPHWL